jgi:fluoroquinolone resistance protein
VREIVSQIDNGKRYYSDFVFADRDFANVGLSKKEFDTCKFIGCNFSNAEFKECKFIDCDFKDCNLSLIKINKSHFHGIYFQDSKIIGVNWTEANWPKFMPISPFKFFKCTLNYSNFYGLNLREVEIIDSIAHEVDFRDTDLTLASLTGTDFDKCLFVNTNLIEADLRGSINYNINLFNNKIKKAKFSLPDAINLLACLEIVIC